MPLQETQIDKDFQAFQEMTPEFHQFYSQEAVSGMYALVEQRLEEGGRLSSVSEFIRAFEDLKKSGLPKLRGPIPKPEQEAQPFTLTVNEYRSIPTRIVALKYRNQPEFRQAVDSLIARGLI